MGVEKYPEALEFILHWGEMGTHWGANRSVAQVHALLYLSDKPLDAEAIARKAMAIAADICVYTNGNLTVESLP